MGDHEFSLFVLLLLLLLLLPSLLISLCAKRIKGTVQYRLPTQPDSHIC